MFPVPQEPRSCGNLEVELCCLYGVCVCLLAAKSSTHFNLATYLMPQICMWEQLGHFLFGLAVVFFLLLFFKVEEIVIEDFISVVLSVVV